MIDAGDARVPPHSIEAEQSVLGSALIDAHAWHIAAGVLGASDFYRRSHGVIWSAVGRLIAAGQPADVITVGEALRVAGEEGEDYGFAYLNRLAASVFVGSSVKAYAAIVRERSISRAVVAAADELARDGWSGKPPAEAIDRALVRLLALQQGVAQREPAPISDLLPEWVDALNARADGKVECIPTGLHGMDRLMGGGLRRGELMVIGARPSMGKSALSLTISRSVAQIGPVLVCSMEDSDQMLVSRQVAAAGRVNLADIRSPARAPQSMWAGVTEGVEMLQPLLLHIDDQPGLALRDVRHKAMQVKRRRGDLLLLVVDYLQLMTGEGDNRHQQLGLIANGLKSLAKELKCAVMLLSQLNREADKISGPPRMEHLRDSGSIEEAADIIGLLWREHRVKPKPENKHTAQVEFAKHKNGPTDTVRLWFDGATQRFADLSEAEC